MTGGLTRQRSAPAAWDPFRDITCGKPCSGPGLRRVCMSAAPMAAQKGFLYPLHSLLCGFRGEESGLEAEAAAAVPMSTARSPPAGQIRVSPGAFGGWAA